MFILVTTNCSVDGTQIVGKARSLVRQLREETVPWDKKEERADLSLEVGAEPRLPLEKINTEKRGEKKLVLIVREFSATSGWLGTIPIIVFNEENVQSIKYVIRLLVKYSWLMSSAFSFPKFVTCIAVLCWYIWCNLGIWYWYQYEYRRTYQSGRGVVLIHKVHYGYMVLISIQILKNILVKYLTYISIRFIPTIYQEKIRLESNCSTRQTWKSFKCTQYRYLPGMKKRKKNQY